MAQQEAPIEKAYIKILIAGTYGNIKYSEDEQIKVQFNPNEYSIKASSSFKPEKSGIKQLSNTYGTSAPMVPKTLDIKLI